MRRLPAALLASMLIVWCSSAVAQEAAPADTAPPQAAPTAVAPGEIPPANATPEPLWGTPPAPLPTSATPAPAAAQAPAGTQLLSPRDLRRRIIRHEREVERLKRAMDREGPEYSEEAYQSYRSRSVGGVVLVALGGVGIVGTIFYGLYVMVTDASTVSAEEREKAQDGDGEDLNSATDGEFGEPGQRIALWSMFIGGIAGLAVGVPLLVTGMQGKKRQDILRKKDEILAPFDPYAITASLSLFADSQGNVGGLRLKVTF
jgi:hypothetical protein